MPDVYSQGRAAFNDGQVIDDCPHADFDQYALWRDGWEDGQRERRAHLAESCRHAAGADVGLQGLLTMKPARIADVIGIPLEQWPGNCFAVAVQMNVTLELGLTACYGHYRGPVHKASRFSGPRGELGFCNHGWLQTPDGRIVDPSRFVFENDEPYVYIGSATSAADYDRGGNVARKDLFSKPRPARSPELGKHDLGDISEELKAVLAQLLDAGPDRTTWLLSPDEMFWLCNQPNEDFAGVADEFFLIAESHGCRGFIPFDNWQMAMEARAQRTDSPTAERCRG